MCTVGCVYRVHKIEKADMFFEDLSNYSYYLKQPLNDVKNVGWLAANQSFSAGKPLTDFLLKLEKIIASQDLVNVHVNQIRGVHPCSLSSSCKGIVIGGGKIGLGSSEIWIPSAADGKQYFASPSLIFHYIRDHNYIPPEEFIEAVEKMRLDTPFKAQDKYIELVAGHF